MELLGGIEKTFIQAYHARLKKEQSLVEEESIVFTRIPLSYSILNSLYDINIVFHPKSLGKSKSWDKSNLSINENQVKETLEKIIIYETTSTKPVLTTIELQVAIEHFRALQGRKSV